MNKTFLIAILIGVFVIGGGVLALMKLQPSMQEQQEQALAGAVREGSPEFEVLTKRIVAETDAENTWFSPVGTGTVMMNIAGKIRNYSDKSLTGLEIRVSVVDSSNKVVKDKTVAVIPTQAKKLDPKQEMNVTIAIEGFSPDDDRANIRWKVTAIKVEK